MTESGPFDFAPRSEGLTAELARSRERAQAALEEALAANDELQAANEELAASEEELRSANARLQAKSAELTATGNDLISLLASIDVAVLFLDSHLRIKRFNRPARDLIDLIPADVGRPFTDLRWKFTDPDLAADTRAVFDRLIPVEREVAAEGGRQYLRRVLPHRTWDDRIDGTVVTFLDLTARKQMEAQLRQAQKMEVVGRLAAGVAHDFNNLLTVINGYAALLVASRSADDPDLEPMREILAAGKRATDLTGQLLAFGRRQVLAPKDLDLNHLIADLTKMLQRLLGEDVQLTTALSPSPIPVTADPGQIEQVIANLCVNARDAMPTGGRVTITTGTVTRAAVPGRFARVAVTDTGTGMTEDVKAQIFEPFFTTKGAGQGTGLGLATVLGIVEQSGGHVEVVTAIGQGTTFEVYLPANGNTPVRHAAVSESPAPGGTETILLVEDEGAVRDLAAHVLRGAGYTILEASNSAEAEAAFATARGAVHLLLADVVMPGKSGRELAARLGAAGSVLRVLFTSGHTEEAVVRHGITSSEVALIQKPFAVDTLLRKVREVLDAGVE